MCLTSFFCKLPGIRIPRTGDQAAQYSALWTLTKEGQKKYGGWLDDAILKYDENIDFLIGLRKADEQLGKVFQQYLMNIMRETHKIPEGQTSFNGPVTRKKKIEPAVPDPTKRKKKKRNLE